MTITTGTSVFNPFTTLQSISQSMATVTQNQQMANIAQDLQNQLNRQLAAIQPTTDQVSIDISQNRIKALQSQQKTISGLETQFGNNGSILSDMANQLNLMTQAVGKSDNTAFDNALSALNTDYTILTPPAWNAIFQSDGMAQFKMAGSINIQSSATYDLSTQTGQDAATADITNVSNLVQSILKINGANQTVAASSTHSPQWPDQLAAKHTIPAADRLATSGSAADQPAHAEHAEHAASDPAQPRPVEPDGHGAKCGAEPAAAGQFGVRRADECDRPDRSRRRKAARPNAGGDVPLRLTASVVSRWAQHRSSMRGMPRVRA